MIHSTAASLLVPVPVLFIERMNGRSMIAGLLLLLVVGVFDVVDGWAGSTSCRMELLPTSTETRRIAQGVTDWVRKTATPALLGAAIMGSSYWAGPCNLPAFANDVQGQEETYDGFADYAAKGKKMDDSDVGCFFSGCGDQTKACFTDGTCLKGVTCLGRCQGEQNCATRCFAQYGGEKLDNWLSCTLEEKKCVKVPENIESSLESDRLPVVAKGFNPSQLQGTWYKVLGLNRNYDGFDCQLNTFENSGDSVELKVDFRVANPDIPGAFWSNSLTENLEIDAQGSGRSLHTEGRMFGLKFSENWYVIGANDKPGDEFVFVQYQGRTLQGSYKGGFVYAKAPQLSAAARSQVNDIARTHDIDPSTLFDIDNKCLPNTAGGGRAAEGGGPLQSLMREFGFVYDLVEWVRPGTIHSYDQ